MEQLRREELEIKSNIFKALSHPSRLLILEEIADQECCVGDLVKMIGHDFSTVSRHLSVLKNAGIVKDFKRNNQVFYSVIMPCVLEFIRCVGPDSQGPGCAC
jgi:DNA-binding transcriptional ArsR family regulator